MLRRFIQACAVASAVLSSAALAMDRPNILVIWGDDIGFWNLSTNNMGMMGYQTPNIDRIATEGAKFTDYYGQQSCTAGRSAFITGQSPIRTGLTKVGVPGADLGIRPEDVTLATLLKEQGCVVPDKQRLYLTDTSGVTLELDDNSFVGEHATILTNELLLLEQRQELERLLDVQLLRREQEVVRLLRLEPRLRVRLVLVEDGVALVEADEE